jgi:hypothetical protein
MHMTLSLTLLLATAAPALAGDVHIVDSSGAGDYPTIQQALNNAADEDLILVRPGSYPSFVVDDLDISIIADGGTVSTGTVRVRDLSADKTLDLALGLSWSLVHQLLRFDPRPTLQPPSRRLQQHLGGERLGWRTRGELPRCQLHRMHTQRKRRLRRIR